MRRREVVAFLATAAASPQLALAQERTKVARIGFLGPAPAANFAPRVDALRAGLRELGYVEGKDLTFEFRWWEAPEEMPDLAADLVRAKVDLIVAPSSSETAVLLAATRAFLSCSALMATQWALDTSQVSRARAAMPPA
jgi:putative tryptophan/tyrosine transport system substrate-binding protein